MNPSFNDSSAPLAAQTAEAGGDPGLTSAPGHGHVLLVDDEAAFQRLGGAFLRSLGHEVTLAGDGTQALAAFSQRRPELVLLDLAMPPHMDPEIGLELIPRFAPVPVVVLTGRTGGKLAALLRETDVLISVPHDRAARVREVHALVLHCISDGVDAQLLGDQEIS